MTSWRRARWSSRRGSPRWCRPPTAPRSTAPWRSSPSARPSWSRTPRARLDHRPRACHEQELARPKGDDVTLYGYFRSSAAYRVRIALNLKGLAYEAISIHLQKEGGMNLKPEYRAINPQMRVPALKLDTGAVLTQSLAIIDYLDET